MLQEVNWANILMPDTPVVEIVVRGTITYVAILLLLRSVLRRHAGSVNTADLLVIVLIADAAQNAMAGTYTSIPDGLILVATIIAWAWIVDWLGYRLPAFERLINPPPLPIVRDGRLMWRNMRRELITRDELMTQLREQGVLALSDVRAAFVEGDGRISVVTRSDPGEARRQPRRVF